MTDEDEKKLPFHEMGLDDRILKAIAKLGWVEPTLIQERGIPLILEGKDLLARGRTGSGKTGAFAVPLIQRLLDLKSSGALQYVRAVVLCPSRELASQTTQVINDLTNSCGGIIRCVDIGAKDVAAVKPLLKDLPDVLVGTPGRLAIHIKEGNLDLSSLQLVVIDEADLVFSFGFEADLRFILGKLPAIYQAILTSATLSADVDRLKKLILHNPVVLRLSEPDLPDSSQLTQYVIKLEEVDKVVLIYALFKLELIKGKTLVFVSSVDRCYKVKLYLEQFSIPCCVLNSELPVATRCHTVNQFNKGVYSVIIAADEKLLDDKGEKQRHKVDKDKERGEKNRNKDKESGVSRGIDFQFVANVINFDFPASVDSYIHRVGRTARGNQQGTALSLVSAKENELLEAVEVRMQEISSGQINLKPYQFKMEELDGFKYRARDSWRSVTKIAVREARLKEIKQEILNSTKLKSYFEDNPRDQQVLRHDKVLHVIKRQEHLKNVPEYIVPETLKKFTGNAKRKKNKNKNKTLGPKPTDAQKKFDKRNADPLDMGISKRRRK